MKKMVVGLVALWGLAGLVAVASAHMRDGGHQDRRDYYTQNGWNCGMGPGRMSHSGYCCDDPAWSTSAGAYSANLLTRDEAQRRVEAFAGQSFPGYQVGMVEPDGYRGQPFFTASLTGNGNRFEVHLNAVDGRVIGVYPIEE